MIKWQYLALHMNWIGEKEDWEGFLSDGTKGDMVDFLNSWGAEGWELVNMVDEFSYTYADGIREVRSYQAFFKRPLED